MVITSIDIDGSSKVRFIVLEAVESLDCPVVKGTCLIDFNEAYSYDSKVSFDMGNVLVFLPSLG